MHDAVARCRRRRSARSRRTWRRRRARSASVTDRSTRECRVTGDGVVYVLEVAGTPDWRLVLARADVRGPDGEAASLESVLLRHAAGESRRGRRARIAGRRRDDDSDSAGAGS